MFRFLWIHCLGNKNNMGSGIRKISVHSMESIICNLYNREKRKVKLCALCGLHLVFKLCKYLWLKRADQKNKHTILRQKLEPTMSIKD